VNGKFVPIGDFQDYIISANFSGSDPAVGQSLHLGLLHLLQAFMWVITFNYSKVLKIIKIRNLVIGNTRGKNWFFS
jgi:hypothetical protein